MTPHEWRARAYKVAQLGQRQYAVFQHPANITYVDFDLDDPCHCGDALFRRTPKGLPCKHLIAIKFFQEAQTAQWRVSSSSPAPSGSSVAP